MPSRPTLVPPLGRAQHPWIRRLQKRRSNWDTGWPTASPCGPQHLQLRGRRHGAPRRHPRFWEGATGGWGAWEGRVVTIPGLGTGVLLWIGVPTSTRYIPWVPGYTSQRGKKLHQPCIMHESTVWCGPRRALVIMSCRPPDPTVPQYIHTGPEPNVDPNPISGNLYWARLARSGVTCTCVAFLTSHLNTKGQQANLR